MHHTRQGIVAVIAGLLAAAGASASSHREAPFVTENPKVDATDFYMFRSYEAGREDYVTIIANYLPLQDPYGGPNYFSLDPQAVYQIHIDNDADAREDLTFSFRFNVTNRGYTLNVGGRSVPVPLVNVGPVSSPADPNLNVVESYNAQLIVGDRDTGLRMPVVNKNMGGWTFLKPADNIGKKSIPNYDAYADQHMYDFVVPGREGVGRIFVGQRKDPFVVNLGETFDLVNNNPLGPEDGETDDLADKNVTSIILEVPISMLTNGEESVIGGWTTASLPKNRSLLNDPTFEQPAHERGQFVQVSRLGMPLVNEVVVGLEDKNLFNASEPSSDGQFLDYVTNPTLPALLQSLFGVTAPCTPRNDLVAVFLTGVDGLNQPANVTPSEMLRLNTAIPPVPAGSQHRLGVLGGDIAGFPNGRRPGDDVVDMALRVVMGVLLPTDCAPHGQLPYTDGAYIDDSFFDDQFPYLVTPIPGSPNG